MDVEHRADPNAGPRRARLVQTMRADAEHMAGVMDSTLVIVWRASVSIAVARFFAKALHEACERWSKVGVLLVSKPSASARLDDEVSAVLAAAIRDAVPELQRVASVVIGTGFRASSQRSAIVSVGLQARQPCPIELFGDLERACGWLAKDDPRVGRDELLDAVERWLMSNEAI